MKKNFIKILAISVVFTALSCGIAFCDEGRTIPEDTGIDITKLKEVSKIKNVFSRKQKDIEPSENFSGEINLNEENIEQTTVEDEPAEINADEIISDIENSKKKFRKNKKEKKVKEKKTKENKANKKFSLFKRNKKQNEEIMEELPEENTTEGNTYYNEGDLVYIKEVEILGNNLLDINYIKEQMNSQEGTLYNRSEVSSDLRALYNTGYFTKNLRALPIKIDESNVKLRIVVEENPPLTDFGIVGNNSVSSGEILAILDEYKGKPLNVLNINEAINRIQELYSSKGYILAHVTKVADDPDGYINILIDEGIIGDIIVEGNNKTKDFIVKRNILLQPGSVYNENTMRSDILRLMGTQAFKDVQRELKQDETTGLYDVYVELEEQRTGRISLGVGIDSASGFFGTVGFSENNFRGLGQKLSLNLLAGTGVLMNDSSVVRKPNFQGELSFLEPEFKNPNQSLAIRGFGRYYGSYLVPLAVERRFGGEVTLARKFTTYRNLTGSLGFGVEDVDISEGDRSKMMARYNAAGYSWNQRKDELTHGLYVKITPALTYDSRDSSMNARHGLLARVMFEENIGMIGTTFGKLTGMARKFFPLGRKSSVVITAKAGGKIHGSMPEFAGYYLGGPYTIRGFNIADVGAGDGYMLGSAEVRVPIPFIDRLTSNSFLNNLRLAAFVDAGTLFNKSIGTRIYDKPGYAISAGVGLRVFIPGLGPINLDYGIPFTNTKSIHRSGGFFTFGMGEMY